MLDISGASLSGACQGRCCCFHSSGDRSIDRSGCVEPFRQRSRTDTALRRTVLSTDCRPPSFHSPGSCSPETWLLFSLRALSLGVSLVRCVRCTPAFKLAFEGARMMLMLLLTAARRGGRGEKSVPQDRQDEAKNMAAGAFTRRTHHTLVRDAGTRWCGVRKRGTMNTQEMRAYPHDVQKKKTPTAHRQ